MLGYLGWFEDAPQKGFASALEQLIWPIATFCGRQLQKQMSGTLKTWMCATHFLTKTFNRVSTEMSPHVFAYNFKRVLNLLGNSALIEAMKA
ncbi:hypothetical protein BWR15_25615 [Pseudomonas sp. T]|nr:hypothetical protein BWR15_25615 [Pseudomonas sp. T]